VVGRAELLGDRGEGQAINEESPQGSVATMERLVGLQEEASARGVVHDAAPHQQFPVSAGDPGKVLRLS
jgi:hypothetical protein